LFIYIAISITSLRAFSFLIPPLAFHAPVPLYTEHADSTYS